MRFTVWDLVVGKLPHHGRWFNAPGVSNCVSLSQLWAFLLVKRPKVLRKLGRILSQLKEFWRILIAEGRSFWLWLPCRWQAMSEDSSSAIHTQFAESYYFLLMWKQQVRLLSWLWNLDQGNFASLGLSFFYYNPQCISWVVISFYIFKTLRLMDVGNGCQVIIHICIKAVNSAHQGSRGQMDWVLQDFGAKDLVTGFLINKYLKSFSQVKCPLYYEDRDWEVSSHI